MKTNLQMNRVVLVAFLLLSTVGISAQTNEKAEKQKHVKMVMIEDGEKTVLDTLLTGDETDFDWIDEQEFTSALDSSLKRKLKHLRYEFSGGENEEVFVFGADERPFAHHRGNRIMIKDTVLEGDSARTVVMIRRGDGPGKGNMHFRHDREWIHAPMPPHPPKRVEIFDWHSEDKTVIRLDDPNVISYKKKDLSGGREKIEIIRKKQEDRNPALEIEEEIIIEDE